MSKADERRSPDMEFYKSTIVNMTKTLQASWDILAGMLKDKVECERIGLHDGDILVLRIKEEEPSQANYISLSRAGVRLQHLIREQRKDIIILVIPSDLSLDAIDPGLLEEHGWQRKNSHPLPE